MQSNKNNNDSHQQGKVNINNYIILYEGYNPHNQFYVYSLQEKGINIDYGDKTKLVIGDRVIVSQPQLHEYITNNYVAEIINDQGLLKIYEIKNF